MRATPSPIRISLLAIPDSMALPINGIYESMQVLEGFRSSDADMPMFEVLIVGNQSGSLVTPTGLPINVHRSFDETPSTDVVIATSMAVNENDEWVVGRYPEAVSWLRAMNRQGAVLCSSCTGVLLAAETGLLNGRNATIHWAYEPTFRRNFPKVKLNPREILVTDGGRQEFVMAGASSSWQDLVLYLVGRFAGTQTAQALAHFMLFQWHIETQAPYMAFCPSMDHGDAVVRELQEWLRDHAFSGSPVEDMVRRSGLAESTFKRRFKKATGYNPISYVQNLRIEHAKRRLENSTDPVDIISWQVGYEDPAFFRRLFKRATCMTPREYRRRFQIPAYASR